MKSLKIIFAGTPAFGLPCLNALGQSSHKLKAIYTQPDRLSGRGRKVNVSPIKHWAETKSLPVQQPINFKESSALEILKAYQPDLMIVIAYGLILPQTVLDIPRFGCINVHASLLPRWRGASPIQQAILHQDHQSGITIMQMDKGMDTGKMLAQAACVLNDTMTAQALHDALAQLAVKPLLDTLDLISQNKIQAAIQEEAKATYAPKIMKQDGQIDWQEPAEKINAKIRAFNPWPGAYTYLKNNKIQVHQASIITKGSQEKPGTIVSTDKTGIMVAAANHYLKIEILQSPGAKIMRTRDWLNGQRLKVTIGDVFQASYVDASENP